MNSSFCCRRNVARHHLRQLLAVGLMLALLATWGPGTAPVRGEGRPFLYGCGITWGNWLQLTGETAREWDRRSMDKIVEMGGTNCPANFAWIDVEPVRGTYDWSYVDHQVNEAEARGLEIFAYSGLTPDWALDPAILAQYGSGIGYRFPPEEEYIPDFEAFFTALAARYAGRVKYYEFWNEPNGCSWINDGCANGHMAYSYVPWLIRWYDAMKAGDPNCVLAVGGLDYNSGVTHGYRYIEDIYAFGGGDHFDAVAIHPYGEPLYWQAIHDTYQVLVNHGDGHKKLWLNEYGWNTSDENLKSQYLTTVLNTLKQPEYHMVFQANHLIITDLPGTPDWGHDYGLCSRNVSTLTITPRQSWYAFQALDKTFPGDAGFSATNRRGPAPLTVQFTDESTVANPTQWLWDFGDGQTSNEQNPAHTYTQEGTFDVTLTVQSSDPEASFTREAFVGVGNGFRSVAFIAGQVPPTSADAQVIDHLDGWGLTVDVYDDEASNRPPAAQIAATHDLVIGSSTLLSANLADEFRNEPVPFVFWESGLAWDEREALANGPGITTGQVRLNVIDNAHPIMRNIPTGLSDVATAGTDFSNCTDLAGPGVQVLATHATESNRKVVVAADAGAPLLDGGTAADKRAMLFLYDTTWNYLNDTGKKIFDNTLAWALGRPAPAFSATPTDGLAPLTVDFTDESTGPVTSWNWDFGDGGTSRLRHPTHTFEASGYQTVTLTVTGPGSTESVVKTDYIEVYKPIPIDFDRDDDVDMEDYGVFQACYSAGWLKDPACAPANLDGDADVDMSDYWRFMRCFSGPDVPAPLGCFEK